MHNLPVSPHPGCSERVGNAFESLAGSKFSSRGVYNALTGLKQLHPATTRLEELEASMKVRYDIKLHAF